MITISHDKQAGEIVIRTPQGMILINECKSPCMTRVVILPTETGYLSVTESPAIVAMWAGVQIAAEPLTDDDDTEEMILPVLEEESEQ